MAITTKPETPTGRRARSAEVAKGRVGGGLLDPKILWHALPDAFKKLDPRVQIKNPVMFVVEVGAVLCLYTAVSNTPGPSAAFNWTIVVWLWLTVVFANLAEAVAEGRGKAQAETLRKTKRETVARRLADWRPGQTDLREAPVAGTQLTLGDHVIVEAGGPQHLNRDIRLPGDVDEMRDLGPHRLRVGLRSTERGLIDNRPQLKRVLFAKQFLPAHAQFNQTCDLVCAGVRSALFQDRPRVCVDLEQARNEARLVCPDDFRGRLQREKELKPLRRDVVVAVPPPQPGCLPEKLENLAMRMQDSFSGPSWMLSRT